MESTIKEIKEKIDQSKYWYSAIFYGNLIAFSETTSKYDFLDEDEIKDCKKYPDEGSIVTILPIDGTDKVTLMFGSWKNYPEEESHLIVSDLHDMTAIKELLNIVSPYMREKHEEF